MTHLGVIGLGTMGANLARNAARNGATVAVFNRTSEKTDGFLKAHGSEGSFVSCKSLEEMVKKLPTPRAILLMVKAGEGVDEVIKELTVFLSSGDILIDGGNSHYRDTERRQKDLFVHGIQFVGMGVSGGEEGALNGPSMMPGGLREAVESLMPLLQKMAADDGDGGKCVTYIGPGGSGHFVKMVHNGIEYALMQLIAEVYDIVSRSTMQSQHIADLFKAWSTAENLGSYLLEITATILQTKDQETGKLLIDLIKDAAGQKGTGKWTTDAAMQYGVPLQTITAAVDARILSGSHWREGNDSLPFSGQQMKAPDVRALQSALELGSRSAYEQGACLIMDASAQEKWDINIAEVCRIWRGGCIIRSVMLPQYQKSAMDPTGPATKELLERYAGSRQSQWREVVASAMQGGIPVPTLSASITYYDSLRQKVLPQRLIQAQRDYFGAHGFERIDKSRTQHGPWHHS